MSWAREMGWAKEISLGGRCVEGASVFGDVDGLGRKMGWGGGGSGMEMGCGWSWVRGRRGWEM